MRAACTEPSNQYATERGVKTMDFLYNPGNTGIHKLAGRSAIIPAAHTGVYYGNKEDSEMLQSLNGDYLFLYRTSDDMNDFYRMNLDDSDWDTIDVPSMWQYRGYGQCAYTNISYPFPFNPPYIDADNPVGYYRRHFYVQEKTARTILHFGGVDNAFFVYLNGQFVGASKGSRNAAEFDVTSSIVAGDNLLAVKVMTYSDASYLEAQDMLLANGIFRDVYLLHLQSFTLWDYRVSSDLKNFFIDFKLKGAIDGDLVCVKIGDKEKTLPAKEDLKTTFVIDEPHLWNAEDPFLYPLTITLLRNQEIVEVHSKRIGMMHSEMHNWKFLVNGSPVYIKGINRHETDCDNGRAISREAIEREVRMIKENHLNAIRTSHYPNDPYFYELCSQIGLYVMDEADLETHGCQDTGDQGYLSKLPEWRDAYLDRVQRMLELDKNEVCVFIHSMGNECGAGENMLACQRLAAAFDPHHVAIHDMEVNRDKLMHGAPLEEGDNLLRMGYLSRAELEQVDACMPIYMQIEYAHAMGNSPGFLRGYQEYLYAHPKCIGGFLWEFKSHSIRRKNKNGPDDFLYGGDFNDCGHWSNFCLDGYLRADGTPKPSWREVAEAFSPVFVSVKGNDYEIRNTYDFTNLAGTECIAELQEDTDIIESWRGALPDVLPHHSFCLEAPLKVKHPRAGAVYYINLYFYRDGQLIGRYQHKLGALCSGEKYIPQRGNIRYEQHGNTVAIETEHAYIRIEEGMLSRYETDGISLLSSPMSWNFLRAPIDNDGITGMYRWAERDIVQWDEALLKTLRFAPRNTFVENIGNSVRISVQGRILPQSRHYGLDAVMQYDIDAKGVVLVAVQAVPYGKWPEHLPRIGMRFDMEGDFGNIVWYGRGPEENYCDCLHAAPVGRYEKPVSQSYAKYDRPQDTGNHEETAYLQIGNSKSKNITIVGCPSFAFETHDVSLETLSKARHRSDIVKDSKTHVYIDYRMRGLGSHSCGPLPEPEYELSVHPFTFAFVLAGNCSEHDARILHRHSFGVTTTSGKAEGTNENFSSTEGALL